MRSDKFTLLTCIHLIVIFQMGKFIKEHHLFEKEPLGLLTPIINFQVTYIVLNQQHILQGAHSIQKLRSRMMHHDFLRSTDNVKLGGPTPWPKRAIHRVKSSIRQ